ncbi:MAG: HAMP domain-containing protein [Thermoplasmata archaeon]|nr:HAMP domain-containing protein [Thermoplasmata archaeon]
MKNHVRWSVDIKLALGFLIFYLISGVIPGIVSFFISIFDLNREALDFLIPVLTLPVSLIICLVVGLYLRKWIAKPIKKLVTATEEMARGNLDVDTAVETGDEIESFSLSLSRMKSSLKIAFDMLGPPDMEKHSDDREIKGLAIGEKIVLSLLLFLILNPVITAIPIFLSLDTVFGPFIASFIFSVIMLLIFILYLNKSIMKPFVSLTEAADKISKGDLETKIEVKSSGDIGRLELNFIIISERVQRAMKELESDG